MRCIYFQENFINIVSFNVHIHRFCSRGNLNPNQIMMMGRSYIVYSINCGKFISAFQLFAPQRSRSQNCCHLIFLITISFDHWLCKDGTGKTKISLFKNLISGAMLFTLFSLESSLNILSRLNCTKPTSDELQVHYRSFVNR